MEQVAVAWKHVFETYDPDTVAWVGTFAIHEVTYFFVGFLYMLLDFVPMFQKYKLQQVFICRVCSVILIEKEAQHFPVNMEVYQAAVDCSFLG